MTTNKTAVWVIPQVANQLADYLKETSPRLEVSVVSHVDGGHSIWTVDKESGVGSWLTVEAVKTICNNKPNPPSEPFENYPFIDPTPRNYVSSK